MKIDLVLTACTLGNKYEKYIPYVYKCWKYKFNLDCYFILISDHIPKYLEIYEKNIILFKPIEGINDIYISQVIRIYYPALFNNKNVLITDCDIVPISKKYFLNSIENYNDEKFICFTDRYFLRKQIAICYCIANSKTWGNIFQIKNEEDVRNLLINNYNQKYIGKKNGIGWFSDQEILYNKVFKWNKTVNNLIILKDNDLNFNRLNNGRKNFKYILQNKKETYDMIEKEIYTDFHCYSINKKGREKIIQEIIEIILKLYN